MTKVVSINQRGTLTIPKEMRDRLGIKSSGQVVVEKTPEGVLLRPGVKVPVEVYSEEQLAEFTRNNESALAGFNLKR